MQHQGRRFNGRCLFAFFTLMIVDNQGISYTDLAKLKNNIHRIFEN